MVDKEEIVHGHFTFAVLKLFVAVMPERFFDGTLCVGNVMRPLIRIRSSSERIILIYNCNYKNNCMEIENEENILYDIDNVNDSGIVMCLWK